MVKMVKMVKMVGLVAGVWQGVGCIPPVKMVKIVWATGWGKRCIPPVKMVWACDYNGVCTHSENRENGLGLWLGYGGGIPSENCENIENG